MRFLQSSIPSHVFLSTVRLTPRSQIHFDPLYIQIKINILTRFAPRSQSGPSPVRALGVFLPGGVQRALAALRVRQSGGGDHRPRSHLLLQAGQLYLQEQALEPAETPV